jgi:hypothetical protein
MIIGIKKERSDYLMTSNDLIYQGTHTDIIYIKIVSIQ